MKNKRIPLIISLLCIGQYFVQGISSLPEQCIYYLSRETWHLSASMIGLISWVTGLAWYCKIFFAYFVDNVPINKKRTTYYLIGSYLLLLLLYGYILIFGLSLISLIVTGLIINIAIAMADVTVDREMVRTEQRLCLSGKLQSEQWISLGIAGLVVALGGAFIASKLPEPLNYKVAYGLAGVVPFVLIYLLFTKFKERKIRTKSKPFKTIIKSNYKKFKDKRLLMGLLFIACLNFCPSFGTALMIRCREVLHVEKMFLGYLGAMGTVLGVIGYFLYYKWAYRFPIKKMLYFMVIFAGLTNLCYLYLPNKEMLLIYNIAFGAVGGITFMALMNFFVHIIPRGSEAFFYAIVTSVSNFTARGGNYFGGIIYDKYGYSWTVLLSSILTLVCVLFIPYLQIKESCNG